MEAFTKTYMAWWRLRDRDAAPFYVRNAVINNALSRGRKLTREIKALTQLARLRHREDIDPISVRSDSMVIWEAVWSLPRRQRACVVLFYFDDQPEDEIARILDCSIGTVKTHLHRARSRLAEILTDER